MEDKEKTSHTFLHEAAAMLTSLFRYRRACAVKSSDHREITSRGAKPLSSSLKSEPFGSRHCTFAYISWFKEQGWKYFCRNGFVCFTVQYSIIQSSTNLNSMIDCKINSIHKITPLSTQRKGWSTQKEEKSTVWSICIISLWRTKLTTICTVCTAANVF